MEINLSGEWDNQLNAMPGNQEGRNVEFMQKMREMREKQEASNINLSDTSRSGAPGYSPPVPAPAPGSTSWNEDLSRTKFIMECENLSWSEIDKKGIAPKLIAADPALYNRKFKEQFGKDHPVYGSQAPPAPTGSGNASASSDQAKAAFIKQCEQLTWSEIDKQGLTPKLIEADPALYNRKFKAKFGKDMRGFNTGNEYLQEFERYSWDELYKMDKLELIRADAPAMFRTKYYLKYGKEYTGK